MGLIILAALFLTACSSKEATKDSGKFETAVKKLKKAAKEFEEKEAVDAKESYAIGETITFDKEAAITVTGATYTEERNQFADVNPIHVLVVTYNVDNLSDDDYYVGSEVELYVNGKKMDTYPVSVMGDTISPGRSFEGASQAFAITEEGDYELEVKPSISFNTKPAIIPFKVN